MSKLITENKVVKGNVEIHTKDGMVTVPAYIKGLFAVHRAYLSSKNWTVTHIPTGYGLASTCKFRLRKQAFQYIAKIKNLIDWDSNNPNVINERLKAVDGLWKLRMIINEINNERR